MVDVTSKPQIVEHIHKSLTMTVYDTKWIPSSARFVVLGSPPRGTGMIQVYQLNHGDATLLKESEKKSAFKCGTFGASSLLERHLATGSFDGHLSLWDLDRMEMPIFDVKGHETIVNCVDGCGGPKGSGAPEIVTGGRDGAVRVWDPRQKEKAVFEMLPEAGGPGRDCWTVAFGHAFNETERMVAAGYDNGDVKLLDLRMGTVSWSTNVANGVCGLEFDRQDIEMNKLGIATLESRYRMYDMRTHHSILGYSFLSQPAHESTVWGIKHLPQNRDVFMSLGGNGSLELWKYSYPNQRKMKHKDGEQKGVMGEVVQLQNKTLSTQPICGFDWSPDKEGLAVMGILDQTMRVVVVTKLNQL